MLDQRRLPAEEHWLTIEGAAGVAQAIRDMAVRGAPAIGISAAYGVALAARGADDNHWEREVRTAMDQLAVSRPTAVNLFWALDRMKNFAQACQAYPVADIKIALEYEAMSIADEDVRANLAMGRHGEPLIPAGARILLRHPEPRDVVARFRLPPGHHRHLR